MYFAQEDTACFYVTNSDELESILSLSGIRFHQKKVLHMTRCLDCFMNGLHLVVYSQGTITQRHQDHRRARTDEPTSAAVQSSSQSAES